MEEKKLFQKKDVETGIQKARQRLSEENSLFSNSETPDSVAEVIEKNKKIKKIDSYNDFRDARFHQNLIKFGRLADMNPMPIRLLMMLTQTVATIPTEEDVITTKFDFSTSEVMRYLRIERKYMSNEIDKFGKYEVLLKAVSEFRKAGIDFSEGKEPGNEYNSINFLSSIRFTDYDDILRIVINPEAVDYLRALHKYVATKPKYFIQLSSTVQMCLYLLLKYKMGAHKKHRWEISWNLLKKDLKLEDKPSYDQRNPLYKNQAWRNFYTRILGIEKPKKEIQGIGTPWQFIKKSNGEETGNLATINKYTDIKVFALCYKKGNDHIIVFDIDKKSNEELTLLQPRNNKLKKNKENVESQGLFPSDLVYPSKEAPKGEGVYDKSEVEFLAKEMSKHTGISVEEIISSRYIYVGKGGYRLKE